MTDKVGLLSPFSTTMGLSRTAGEVQDKANSFRVVLASALEEVNRLQLDAQDKTGVLVGGGNVELHEVMLAVQKAELALELTQTVRNKVVEAYQEIMRMQV